MDKREMIERALGQLIEKIVWYRRHGSDAQVSVKELIEYLAEQIVIECEVEHSRYFTNIHYRDETSHQEILIAGTCVDGHVVAHHGTPGKALAIIVPLEEE